MDRLLTKFETARSLVPNPVIHYGDGANNAGAVGILAFGSTDPAIQEARHQLADHGLVSDYLRLRALPPTEQVLEFIREHKRVYVIEMNRDSQLHQILSLEIPEHAASLIPLGHSNGLPLTAKWVRETLLAKEGV